MLESISAGHWVTRCHLDCASEARNSTLTKFQCIKRHIDPPWHPPFENLVIFSSENEIAQDEGQKHPDSRDLPAK